MNTSAKFVADEDSFWYQVHFDGVYCVDQVMSLDSDIYTHTWTCLKSGCGTPCEGLMCGYVDITVFNSKDKDLLKENSLNCEGLTVLPANCGDGVRLSVSKENAASLGYDYFEISEFSVTGRKQGNCKLFGNYSIILLIEFRLLENSNNCILIRHWYGLVSDYPEPRSYTLIPEDFMIICSIFFSSE